MALIMRNPKSTGYGHGRLAGFTDDGQVFVIYDCRAPDGEPMQMRETMTPKQALKLAKDLMTAAGEAHKKTKPLIIQPGVN